MVRTSRAVLTCEAQWDAAGLGSEALLSSESSLEEGQYSEGRLGVGEARGDGVIPAERRGS